jgi:hypothetical protein
MASMTVEVNELAVFVGIFNEVYFLFSEIKFYQSTVCSMTIKQALTYYQFQQYHYFGRILPSVFYF